MKKFLIILFVLVGVSSIRAHAQDYNWAIGVRGGVTATAWSVKYNFDPPIRSRPLSFRARG